MVLRAGLAHPAELTVEAPPGGVTVAVASAGTWVRQLWIEDAFGSSIMAIGLGVIGVAIGGAPAIIGMVMAGDMGPDTPI